MMWKYIIEPDWLQMIWCMYIACSISKATNTLSEYVIILLHCNNAYTKAP